MGPLKWVIYAEVVSVLCSGCLWDVLQCRMQRRPDTCGLTTRCCILSHHQLLLHCCKFILPVADCCNSFLWFCTHSRRVDWVYPALSAWNLSARNEDPRVKSGPPNMARTDGSLEKCTRVSWHLAYSNNFQTQSDFENLYKFIQIPPVYLCSLWKMGKEVPTKPTQKNKFFISGRFSRKYKWDYLVLWPPI